MAEKLAPEIIYDFNSAGSDTPIRQVVYGDDVIRNDKKGDGPWESKYYANELEQLFVDESHAIPVSKVHPNAIKLLNELRSTFCSDKHVFVTYQQVMAYGRGHGWVRPEYKYKASPRITVYMNKLWKAGIIKKYRRGIWQNADLGNIKGMNHGVTYWLYVT